MPARDATGMMLPVLLCMDAVAVWTYRRDANWGILRIMLPGALVGTLLGWLLWSVVTDAKVLLAVGIITLLFMLDALLPLRKKSRAPAAVEALGRVLGRRCRPHQLHLAIPAGRRSRSTPCPGA